MAIDFTTLWHVGVIVPDVEVAMHELTGASGWEWTSVLSRDVEVTVEGEHECSAVRWATNRTAAPQLEVIEAKGGIWSTSEHAGETLHHLAYWSDDLEGDAAGLVNQGYHYEAHGRDDAGQIRFIYLIAPSGVRIELGALWSKPAWDEWTAGEEYSVQF